MFSIICIALYHICYTVQCWKLALAQASVKAFKGEYKSLTTRQFVMCDLHLLGNYLHLNVDDTPLYFLDNKKNIWFVHHCREFFGGEREGGISTLPSKWVLRLIPNGECC